MTSNFLAACNHYYTLCQQHPRIQQRFAVLADCYQALAKQQLPAKPLPFLALSDREFYRLLPEPQTSAIADFLADFRQRLVVDFGLWQLPNQAWLADLATFIDERSVLEVMAGNAAISCHLRQVGIKTIATDTSDWQGQDNCTPLPWTDVQTSDALAAVAQFADQVSVIIMSWAPDDGVVDSQILSYLRQIVWQGDLIVIGERNGATNSAAFWQLAELQAPALLNRHYPTFDMFDDHVWLAR